MRRLPILCVLSVITLVAGSPLATQASEVGISNSTIVNQPGSAPTRAITANGVPSDCSLLTFEGVPDNTPIGTYHGPVDVIFGTSWLGLVDFDNGGSGNFANEPSSSTIAYFLDTNDISIQLNPPVRFVQFQYSAAALSLPVTVYAYDAANNLVGTSPGNTVGSSVDGAQCSGDPNGTYCKWDQINLVSAVDNIAYVKITGAVANYFGIDNLYFCTSTTPTLPSSWGRLKTNYR